MKKSKPNPKANRNILWFVYAAVFLFLAMGIYVGYFLAVKSDAVIDNPYNARVIIFEERVTRGKILADDGQYLQGRSQRRIPMVQRHGNTLMAACSPMRWATRRWERRGSSLLQTLNF
mgnify:CR=1 FL=1